MDAETSKSLHLRNSSAGRVYIYYRNQGGQRPVAQNRQLASEPQNQGLRIG